MKAILASTAGALVHELPIPIPKASEILVRVRAASLNRADLAGLAAGDDKIMGMEWAGDVVEAGAEVQGVKPGDRVMCSGAGAFAEYATTDFGRACVIPSNQIGYQEATVMTVALQAMHDAIGTHGRLRKGETVLIHGASSGVGLMGLQIAKMLGAGVVIGTSTHPGRRGRLKEFGADLSIDPSTTQWVDEVMAATGGRGVDVIVDQVTGKGFGQTMQTAAVCGRIVNLGRLGGGAGEFDFNLHALRRISYTGVTFRTRSVQEVRVLNAKMFAALGPAIAAGKLALPIDRIYPLHQAADALARMASNQHFGKIVLSV